MRLKDLVSEIEGLKREAFESHEWDRFELFAEIGRTLTELGLVAALAKSMGDRTNDEDAWQALFEAIDECGALRSIGDEADTDDSE